MRSFLILAMVCVSCSTKTGLHKGTVDATAEVASAPDAGADGSSVRDVGRASEDLSDVPSACAPLSVTWLPEPLSMMCPPSVIPAACGGGDVGVVVARVQACVQAWGESPLQCGMWTAPAVDKEIVVFKLANCTDAVDTVAALACSDHIAISIATRGTCQACDGTRSNLRAFTLPLDTRPVIATSRHIEPPCPPPPPPDAATDTGGAAGAGGVAGDVGSVGGCAQEPISESKAALAYATSVTPSAGMTYTAEEKAVPGLWQEMHAQLFSGKTQRSDGSTSSECSFIYRDCGLTMLTESCTSFGPILSGVASGGAFYYSWGAGSGVYRTILGKLAPGDAGPVKTSSGAYFNPSSGPPGLVVALEGGQIVVYRATVYWAKFNDWLNPERIGTLVDYGDRLAIVDSNGRELPSILP